MDPITIGMLVILALLIFFMFRSSRKRQKQASQLQEKVVPGAEVMTNFGLFGTIVSIDAENNKVELDTGHGQILTVHRQTVTRVIDPAEENTTQNADEAGHSPAEPELNTDHAIRDEPEYGERVDPSESASSDDDANGTSKA